MRIRKYDFNYGRRELLQKVAYGVGAANETTYARYFFRMGPKIVTR